MQEHRKVWHWLVLALLSIIWGTSYILMKKGLESFSTYQVASLRVLITTIALLPFAIRNLRKLNRDNLHSVIIIGLFGSGIPAFLFPLAQTRIDSSLAGMLNSLSPVFTLVIGIIFYNRRIIRSQAAGVFLGLLGAVGLLYSFHAVFGCCDLLRCLPDKPARIAQEPEENSQINRNLFQYHATHELSYCLLYQVSE
jgi:drug/metabolite transporter (DMT)-like permease